MVLDTYKYYLKPEEMNLQISQMIYLTSDRHFIFPSVNTRAAPLKIPISFLRPFRASQRTECLCVNSGEVMLVLEKFFILQRSSGMSFLFVFQTLIPFESWVMQKLKCQRGGRQGEGGRKRERITEKLDSSEFWAHFFHSPTVRTWTGKFSPA